MGENCEPKDLNETTRHLCREQLLAKQDNTTHLHSYVTIHHPELFASLDIWAGEYQDIKVWLSSKPISTFVFTVPNYQPIYWLADM